MLQPLIVLVTGDRDEELLRAADTLRVALPNVTVRAQVHAGQSLREASANSHLVVDIAERERPAQNRDLVDATVRSPFDLERFIRRVRDVDRRRSCHELPPDLPPSITPWSPSWGYAAQRLGARVAHALTRCGLTPCVDHIGSTAVPGLPAKEIIDLQVSLTRLDNFDEADLALRSAGFVNVQRIVPDAPGVRSDNPLGKCADRDQWEKRLYAGVDDTQRTIVHVRRVGAANWRYALLFRDWLRSNDDRRDAYARVKEDLATEHRHDTNFDAYARAKDSWFDSAYNEAEAWAQTTGWDPGSAGSER